MEASHLHIPSRLTRHPVAHPESWAVQLRWFAAAAAVGFAVPYVGSSVLGLQHDVYLGIYFVAVVGLFAAYTAATGLDLRRPSRSIGSSAWCSGSSSASCWCETCSRTPQRRDRMGSTTCSS